MARNFFYNLIINLFKRNAAFIVFVFFEIHKLCQVDVFLAPIKLNVGSMISVIVGEEGIRTEGCQCESIILCQLKQDKNSEQN